MKLLALEIADYNFIIIDLPKRNWSNLTYVHMFLVTKFLKCGALAFHNF